MTSAITPEALRADYERIWSTTEMRESPEYYVHCLELATPKRDERLLDVACGGGSLLAAAERAGLVTHGLDIADAAIARAKELAPNTKFVRGMAEELPYENGSFDIVTCLGSLEHFIDPAKALEEMRRVLAPGGRAVIVVPNQWFAYDVARGWIEGTGLCHGQESERYFSIQEARDLIGASFAVFHEEGWNPPRALADRTRPFNGRWKNTVLRVYGWLRPRLPVQMAYVFVLVGRREPLDAPTVVVPHRDDVVPGGWHVPEESSRWTSGDASVWIRLGDRVTAEVLDSRPGDEPIDLTLRVDGTTLGTVKLASHAWTDVKVDVPAALRGKVARLTLSPSRTWSPMDHGMRDLRTLGVSVRRIASE